MFVVVHLLLLFVSDFAFFYFIFLLKKTESLTRLKEKKTRPPRPAGFLPVLRRFTCFFPVRRHTSFAHWPDRKQVRFSVRLAGPVLTTCS
jgi:hypothetical protein